MSSASSGRPECSFCGGGGLPILPVRYAVARSDDVGITAPEVSADLQDDTVSQIALSQGQHYTLRLLREGFLYVFNVKRGRWQGYQVTSEGFLSLYIDITHAELVALDPDAPGPLDADINSAVENEEFPCRANPDHVYPGRCITVPAAREAQDIYLAFSDDRWTKRVWKEHATNENGRRDAMRKLSMPQWQGGSAKYARPLSELSDHVAETGFPWIRRQPNGPEATTSEVSALSHSLAPINGIRDDVEGFIDWAQRQAEPSEMTPALFVLDDPVGVTSDLAALLDTREKEFNEQEAIKRPYVTAGIVNALRNGFRERARMQRANKIVEERLEHEYYRTYGGPPGMAHAAKANFERRQTRNPAFKQEVENLRLATLRGISDAELESAANDAWDKYGDKLREGEPDAWMENTYRQQLMDYDKGTIRPLVTAYLDWLTGHPLLTYLDSRFDDRNIESGITFVSVISSVLLATQGYAPAFQQYVEWLSASEIDNSNLLLRGMCLNQQTLVEQIMAASDIDFGAQPNDPATLPWGPLIAAYMGLTETLPDKVASSAWLAGRLLGPLQSAMSATQLPVPLLLIVGMTTGRPVQVSYARVTIEQALPRMREPLLFLHPDWGEQELRQFQQKVRLETRSLIPSEAIGSGQQSAAFDARYINLGPLDDLLSDPGFPLSARAQLDFSASVLGAALALISLQSQFSGMNGILDAGPRAQGRLAGMAIALGAGAAEVVGKTLEHGRQVFLSADRFLGLQRFSLVAGRFLGLAGGVILGAMDLWEGVDRINDEQGVLGSTYLLSGTSTILASSFAFLASIGTAASVAGSTGILATLAVTLWWTAAVFGIFAIAAAVAILWLTEDDLQEWLAECAFGERGKPGPGSARLDSELERLEAITNKEE